MLNMSNVVKHCSLLWSQGQSRHSKAKAQFYCLKQNPIKTWSLSTVCPLSISPSQNFVHSFPQALWTTTLPPNKTDIWHRTAFENMDRTGLIRRWYPCKLSTLTWQQTSFLFWRIYHQARPEHRKKSPLVGDIYSSLHHQWVQRSNVIVVSDLTWLSTGLLCCLLPPPDPRVTGDDVPLTPLTPLTPRPLSGRCWRWRLWCRGSRPSSAHTAPWPSCPALTGPLCPRPAMLPWRHQWPGRAQCYQPEAWSLQTQGMEPDQATQGRQTERQGGRTELCCLESTLFLVCTFTF